MKKRVICSLLILVLVSSMITGCGGSKLIEDSEYEEESSYIDDDSEDDGEWFYSSEEYPLYLMDPYDEQSIELAFFDEEKVIPYISMENTAELLKNVSDCLGHGPEYNLTLTEDGSSSTLTRETGYSMTVDADEDTIHFLDYDAFILPPGATRLIDILNQNDEKKSATTNLFLQTDYAYERYGNKVTLPLSKYNIDIIKTEEGCFIPLQTVSDFLLSDSYVNVLFNGKLVLVFSYGTLVDVNNDLTEMGNLYFSVPSKEIPKELSRFSYNELCLALDHLYGLKELHDIDDFDSFFDNTGLRNQLLNKDPMVADKAILDLVNVHLDDLHSAFTCQSHFNTLEESLAYSEGSSGEAFDKYRAKLSRIRDRYFRGYVPFYEEIGNTAYITFDSFDSPDIDVNYYKNAPGKDAVDTIGIMLYSFSRITRQGSPIENVVLDLSLNTGGELDAAAFVIGMFLGQGKYSVRDALTGALTTDDYYVDSNLDHAYDEKDSLAEYNLFCLESPVSFSCGNLVPCAFKNSHMVTILGQTSGGGTCSVLPMTTATGTVFQLSGHYQLSFVKNGSFYDIDKGADPDYYISKPEHFYDREKLTEFINDLF